MKNMSGDIFSDDPYVYAVIIALVILLSVFVALYKSSSQTNQRDDSDRRVEESIQPESHSAGFPAAKDVFMVMNAQYYDAILSRLTESLKRCGYTLSGDAKTETLLPARVFEVVAREVDTARGDYMTALHYDTREDVAAHMAQGYAQAFLTQLIQSCAQLGWKVTPYVSVAEDECENLSAYLS